MLFKFLADNEKTVPLPCSLHRGISNTVDGSSHSWVQVLLDGDPTPLMVDLMHHVGDTFSVSSTKGQRYKRSAGFIGPMPSVGLTRGFLIGKGMYCWP